MFMQTENVLDTLAFAKRMEAVGFTRQQAEALADEQVRMLDERLATKGDIEALRITTKADIEALKLSLSALIEKTRLELEAKVEKARLETESRVVDLTAKLDARIAESKSDMMRWMFTNSFVQVVTIVGAVAALLKL